MASIDINRNAPHVILEMGTPAASPANGDIASPRRGRSESNSNSGPRAPGLPRLPSRNAPYPNHHCIVEIPLQANSRNDGAGTSANPLDTQSSEGGRFLIPATADASSRNVTFQRKLAATLKTGVGTALPITAINVASDAIGSALTGTMQHSADSLGSHLKTGLAAAGMGLAVDIAVTTMVTVAGHAYLDEKFYHENDTTADEMIATKKANSAVLTYIGGAGSSTALTLAATAMTGGAVTAEVLKSTLISQAVGGLIAHPVLLGATALAYHFRKRAEPAPDSMQAGFEGYASWIGAKLNGAGNPETAIAPESSGPDTQIVRPGDDMV
jgi:hypothetical protein